MASVVTVYDSVGERLGRVLEEKEMMNKDLALKVGCRESHISDLVHDKKKPSLNMLTKISQALDVPVDYFLTGENHYCRNALITQFEPIIDSLDLNRLKLYLAMGELLLKNQEDEKHTRMNEYYSEE